MSCTWFVRIKDSFSVMHHPPPTSLFLSSNTFLTSCPLVLKWASIWPISLRADSLTSPLSLLEMSVLCDVGAYMYACTSSTPAVCCCTKVHVPKLQSSCSDSGMASEDDGRQWGCFNWRFCPEVQPPAMLGPRCASFHGHNVFFFSSRFLFCASWVN